MIKPIILSGGSGSRMWPLSRQAYPKHLIPLFDEHSLFQKAVLRSSFGEASPPIVISNQGHRFLIGEHLNALAVEPEAIILEPFGRNTAPAITIGALYADPDDLLLVLPADQLIKNQSAFEEAVQKATSLAQDGNLVTFGIVPQSAHTGFGYIKQSKPIGGGFEVDEFVEKPDLLTAEAYLASNEYLWNSGMFLFKASAYLEAVQKYCPDVLHFCRLSLEKAQSDLDFMRLDEDAFAQCPDDSIDYAVMEKTDKAVVVSLDADWSDMGSWDAIDEETPHDSDGNAIIGDVLTQGVKNCYIRTDAHLVAAIGVEDLVIVDTPDALMISHKAKVQQVKKIVEQLKTENRLEHLHHTTQYKPWGHHELLTAKPGFEVRRVVVRPGSTITKQVHQHRCEYWIVVDGQGKALCDDVEKHLDSNSSFYVPKHSAHEIANIGDGDLTFIEVQVGSCLKEDDIEHLS